MALGITGKTLGSLLALALALQCASSTSPTPAALGEAEKEAAKEGIDLTLTLSAGLAVAAFIAVFAFVLKVCVKGSKPRYHNRLVLHVSCADLCVSVTLWRGNKCPVFLRVDGLSAPESMQVISKCCLRPRLVMVRSYPLTVTETTTYNEHVLPDSVRLSVFQAWKLRRILRNGRVFCHLEWRHDGTVLPFRMGRLSRAQPLHLMDHSLYSSFAESNAEGPPTAPALDDSLEQPGHLY